MREAQFIKRNKDRWMNEDGNTATKPDELASSFTQLVDDLSYAKTFYPNSKTCDFLNKKSAKIYLHIHKDRKEEANKIVLFWKYDFPLLIVQYKNAVLFSLLIFVVFFILAFWISSDNQNVASEFFGEEYVKTTLENIEKGNPFGVYEGNNPLTMWLGIMINNIKVSFIFYASGIFVGIPTIYKLAETGAMVGIFDQIFYAKGLGLDFWLVVFVHGVLEITSIILACAAGFILGTGALLPGTYSRIKSLKRAAKDSIKIIIGIVPLLTIAAFFEGLITRLYNDVPILTAGITIVSMIFVSWYFIFYPLQLRKKLKI